MKRYNKLIVMIACVLSCFSFASCGDDEVSEWDATYVYLQRNDYLIKTKTFRLQHNQADGIFGDKVTTTFTAMANKPVDNDVIIDLSAKLDGYPDEVVQITQKQVVIKAGETKSEEVTVSVPSWAFQLENRAKVSYKLAIAINSFQTDAENTFLSSKLSAMSCAIHKTAYVNVAYAVPSGTLLTTKEERAAWKMAVSEGTRGGDASCLIDGTSTDIARDGSIGFWVTADFGQELSLTGLQVSYYGAAYSAKVVEIYISTDGINWVSQGEVATARINKHDFKFLQPVTTRYVKYNIVETQGSTISMTEFRAYVQ